MDETRPSRLTKGVFSSTTDLWATPQDFFDKLNDEFHFDLDPCATPDNAKCPIFFTKEEDGLSKDWAGYRVFCNPPYGRAIAAWVKKCYEESQKPDTLVVMLIPARTDTSYFHDYIYHKAELRFIRGRLKFGGSQQGAPFPSMVVIFK
jgi:site-specific DNA-methyltransferase (adenine-specific)